MSKCPQVELMELREQLDALQCEVNDWKDTVAGLQYELGTLNREFGILEGACDFWKQEAINRGYEE